MKRICSILLIIVPFISHAGEAASIGKRIGDGDAQLAAGQFAVALNSCRNGLKELGDSYVSSEVEDDSGMKLIAAELQFKEGRIENAAVVTCRILKERFELWKKKQANKPNNSFNPDALKRAG